MYTIEALQSTLRNPNKKGVLTIQETTEYLYRYRGIEQFAISGDSKKGFCISKAVFFTDDYMFGYKMLPKDWVPSSSRLPMRVVPRPELPSGIIASVEDYMKIFSPCKNW